MGRFILRTLGTLGLEKPGGWVRLDTDSLGLLCLLRLAPDGTLSRADAGRLLWPSGDPAQRLHAAVAAINAATGRRLVTAGETHLQLDVAELGCDVQRRDPGEAGSEDRFLSGFNLPESPAFYTWLVAQRPLLRADPSVAPPQKRLPVSGAAAIGMLGLAGLVAVYATRSTPPAGFEPGDAVAVVAADENPVTLAFAAAALQTLGRTGYLLPYDGTGSRDRPELTVTLAGTARQGGGASLRAVIERSGQDTLLADSASARDSTAILRAMDDLVDRVRARFGERASERRARGGSLRRTATASFAALSDWALGQRALATGDRTTARVHWLGAVQHDSSFAWAHLSLADDAAGRDEIATAVAHYRAALREPSRLPAMDRVRAEAALRALTGSP